MSPRPALITQAEMASAIRAAKKEGAAGVELRRDGIGKLVNDARTSIPAPSGKVRAPADK